MTKILVTGATGQIGTELTLVLRKKHGGENVLAAGHKRPPHPKLLETGPFVTLDVTDRAKLAQAVQEWRITEIYHLAAVLSATGEQNPDLAWQVNMEGLYNVLEVARNFGVQKIFWPSSIAVFGPNTPKDNAPQDAILSPTTMYGITKVAGELLCTYYYQRYGLDVRGLRFPGIISSETPPGGGTTDYAVDIFYHAVRGEPYTCFVRADTVLPMLYMPDCLRATLQLMEADPARLRYRIYNVTGMSFSAEELAQEIQKRVPGFVVEYKPDFRQKIADSWPRTIDDSAAREDWGWKPTYTLTTMVDDMLTALRKKQEQGES